MEPNNAHTNSLHRTLQTVCSGAVLAGLEARSAPAAFPEPAPVTLLLCTQGRYEHLNCCGGCSRRNFTRGFFSALHWSCACRL